MVVTGCYLSRGNSPLPGPVDAATDSNLPPDAGMTDASMPDTSVPDAAPPWDSAVPPTECAGPLTPYRPTRTSVELAGLDGMALPTDEPFDLPISIDDACFCGEQLHCEVNVERGPGPGPAILELTTSVCDGAYLCDGCFPHLDGVCHVPALPAGEYRVIMNDADAYMLRLPTWRSDTEEQVCLTPAPLAPDGLLCPWETTTIGSASQLCVPPHSFDNQSATVTITDGCGNCFDQPADCVVTQQGDRLIVDARTRTCDCPTCGACVDICERVEMSCRLPPLALGTYTVTTVGGELTTTLEVVSGGFGELPPVPSVCTALVDDPAI